MRLAVTMAGLVAFGMVAFELIMQPDSQSRLAALFLFGSLAAGIAVAARLLPRVARRVRTLRVTVALLGVTSLTIVGLAILLAGGQMFISGHDLKLFLVLMGYGLAASMAFAITTSGPLTADLTRIRQASSAIASGDLTVRTTVSRVDEVGQLAEDVDVMAQMLEEADAQRSAEQGARQAMFAAISHDLRTPLASMRAAVEALQDGLAPEPDRYLRSLEADVRALGNLVSDIFLLAQLESGDIELEPEIVDLTEIADETMEILRPLASSRHISISLEADSRVMAMGSQEALSRVMRNLLDNAVRHSPDGGEIVVAVRDRTDAQCRIIDQGPGFSPDFVEQAFERFSRPDSNRVRTEGGSGLGLAIARSYIAALDGSIWAEPGPGGLVTFSLPIATPKQVQMSSSRDRDHRPLGPTIPHTRPSPRRAASTTE